MENSILKIFGSVDVKIAPDLIIQKLKFYKIIRLFFVSVSLAKKIEGYERIFVFYKIPTCVSMFFELVVCFKGGLAYVADLKANTAD